LSTTQHFYRGGRDRTKTLRFIALAFFALSIVSVSSTSFSTDIYKCVKNATVSYQATPCDPANKGKGLVELDNNSDHTGEFTGNPVTLNFRSTPLRSVIQLLANVGGVRLQLDPRANKLIQIRVVNQPWDKVLNDLTTQYNLKLSVEDGVGYITPMN